MQNFVPFTGLVQKCTYTAP